MTLSQKDIRDVADLVAKKLELYMNQERRETRFSPLGAYRTTPVMHKYDLVYKVMEAVDLDQDSPRYKTPRSRKSRSPFRGGTIPLLPSTRKSKSRSPNGKSRERKKERKKSKEKKRRDTSPGRDSSSEWRQLEGRGGSVDTKPERHGRQQKGRSHSGPDSGQDRPAIYPHVEQDSLRVVPNKEADRLTASANEILSEVPVDKLQVIHRYRPNSSDIPNITENGKVQNYTCHVGSALHATKYIDYYMQEGLQSGKREYSKRLQDLKGRKDPESRKRQDGSHPGGRLSKRNYD